MGEPPHQGLAMTKTLVLVLLSATLAFPLVAHASTGECGPGDSSALGLVEISPANDAATTFYIDDRNFALGNGLWLYQESNGIFVGGDVTKDLQRGGTSEYVPDDSDVCVDDRAVVPDSLIQ